MKISVCMATYNGERFIRQQIDSILNQLPDDSELIISDDDSTDNTLLILGTYNDKRIKILHNSNHGVNNNFSNAILHAKGDYIFFCDQDDIWMPNKVKTVIQALQNHVMIVHNAQLIDANGHSLGKTYYECTPTLTGFWGNLWKSRYLGCCMAFRKSILEELMPIPSKAMGHDYWFGLYTDATYGVYFMNDILSCYRRHGNNVSSSSQKSNASLYEMLIKKRMFIVYEILKRRLKIILHSNKKRKV